MKLSNKNDNGNITNDNKDGKSNNTVTPMLLIMTNNDDNHKNVYIYIYIDSLQYCTHPKQWNLVINMNWAQSFQIPHDNRQTCVSDRFAVSNILP